MTVTHRGQSGRNRRLGFDTQLLAHYRANEGFKRWMASGQGQRSLLLNQSVHGGIGLDKQRKKCGVNAFKHVCKLDIFAA